MIRAMESIQNKKGIALVIMILTVYFGVFAALQHLAYRRSLPRHSAESAPPPRGTEQGGFTVTAYCPGRCCNGVWAGLTSAGENIDYYLSRGINIAAVDPAVVPLGSYFIYNDTVYLAVDTGGLIRGKRIDILMRNHPATVAFGVKRGHSVILLDVKERVSNLKNRQQREVL